VWGRHQRAPVVEVGMHRLICRLGIPPPLSDASYCPKDRGILYRETFSYGWWVHQLGSQGSRTDGARRPVTTD
jgi:hypothetical protein